MRLYSSEEPRAKAAPQRKVQGPMFNVEYILVSGVFVAAALALFTMLMRALIAAMEIRSILYSLPVG